MTVIYNVCYSDNTSTRGFSFSDTECPELTSEQFVDMLNEYIKDTYTREMAEQGKSITVTATAPGGIMLARSFMSWSERLAQKD